MKNFTFALLFVSICITTFAVPAKPGIIEIFQPDGTSLSISLFGDPFFNYKTTSDGYLITQNNEGYYVYAQYDEENTLVATSTRANNLENRSASEVAFTKSIGKQILSRGEISEQREAALVQRINTLTTEQQAQYVTNAVGEKGIAILVSFSDVPFTYSNENFDNLLNQEGYSDNGATGSAKDYFKATSHGQFNPDFDVFGPYTLDNTMSYYGSNSYGGTDSHPDQMVVDAVAKLKADASVDVDLSDYDTDGDGYVDNVFIFYAGYGEAEGGGDDTIWPHKWAIYKQNISGTITYDGVTIQVYACSSELTGNSGSVMCGIGAFSHEFSHVLGLPDFYATDGSTHKTCGNWDIMDMGCYNNDAKTPPVFSAHEKFYVGWLTPTVLNEEEYIVLDNLEESNTAYMITATGEHNLNPTSPSPTEYYLLENRQQSGWDTYLPGSGMLISKTAYSKSTWYANTPNNDANSMGYDIIEADGIDNDMYYLGKAGDLFPGSAGVTSYSPYDNYPITQIEEREGYILFSFMGGANDPQTVNFDARQYGISEFESTTEESSNFGIVLPNVTVTDEDYIFVGWSYSEDATAVNAGKADAVYYPFRTTTLYAVYVKDGMVVGADGEPVTCFYESFDDLEKYTTLSSETINNYTDNNGWDGSSISCYNGAIKLSKTGYLTTPELLFYDGLLIKITARSTSDATLTLTVEDASIEKTISLSSSESEQYVYIQDFPLYGKIKITCDVNYLFLNSISFCSSTDGTVDVENVVAASDVVLYSKDGYSTLANVPSNTIKVNCYDIT
ncbi:MAG: M6 family metalloprotease domain-containing protein, partial [bacterium]